MVVQSNPETPRNRGDEDAPHFTPTLPSEDARTVLLNQISWGAVFAGVVISLAVQLILNMLGVGVGASTIDPLDGANPSAKGFGIGAGLWWTVSGIIAAFAGGHVAGRLAGKPRESTTAWHGLVAWAMATLVVFYLLTTALGGLVGGAYRTVANAVGGASEAAGPVLSRLADPFAEIEQAMRSASQGDRAALDAAVTAVQAVVTGDESKAEAAREQAAQAIARTRNIPIEEARKQVQYYEQQYRQRLDEAKQQATEMADATARAVSRGALFGALALILGAVAGWFGGRSGKVEPTLTSARMR